MGLRHGSFPRRTWAAHPDGCSHCLRTCCRSGTETMSDLMVVTILVAADADLKIPRIRGREDLKSALNKLGALRSEQVS